MKALDILGHSYILLDIMGLDILGLIHVVGLRFERERESKSLNSFSDV